MHTISGRTEVVFEHAPGDIPGKVAHIKSPGQLCFCWRLGRPSSLGSSCRSLLVSGGAQVPVPAVADLASSQLIIELAVLLS